MNEAAFDIQSQASMGDFLQRLFKADFMPHGHCFFWRPDVLWLHVVSDLLIALAYYSIPITLVYFVSKRKDVPFNRIFIMFSAFIFLCGTTHIMDIVTMWFSAYRIEGLIKMLTALVSIITAVMLVPIMPKAIHMPSLESLVKQMSAKSQELERSNKELDKFNRIALGRENRIIELKRQVNQLSTQQGLKPPYDLIE